MPLHMLQSISFVRYMDPAIGRFTSIDPLAEKYYSTSPYAYVMNNQLSQLRKTLSST